MNAAGRKRRREWKFSLTPRFISGPIGSDPISKRWPKAEQDADAQVPLRQKVAHSFDLGKDLASSAALRQHPGTAQRPISGSSTSPCRLYNPNPGEQGIGDRSRHPGAAMSNPPSLLFSSIRTHCRWTIFRAAAEIHMLEQRQKISATLNHSPLLLSRPVTS